MGDWSGKDYGDGGFLYGVRFIAASHTAADGMTILMRIIALLAFARYIVDLHSPCVYGLPNYEST